MAKPVNLDVKNVALGVLEKCFDMATDYNSVGDYIDWVDPEYEAMSPDEVEAYQEDVYNFIDAILEGEITMRKPKR